MISDAAVPAMAALIALAVAGWIWHSVTEHHIHLVIARKFNPRIVVPVTRHDTRWHAAKHWTRMAVNAAMLLAAVCLGVAWQLSRPAATAAILVMLAMTACAAVIRGISLVIGHRPRRPMTSLIDDDEYED